MPNTSDWFKSLDRSDRKALLCLLHDVRSRFADSVSRRARTLFLELLQELDDDHDAAKCR